MQYQPVSTEIRPTNSSLFLAEINKDYTESQTVNMIASYLNYERRPSDVVEDPDSPTTSDSTTLDDWAEHQDGAVDHQQSILQYRRSSKKKSKQEWPCTVEGCSVVLYSKSSRFRHQKLHENPENQYHCDKCDAKYLVKLDLVDHERRAHMDKDSYVVCNQCERTFSSMSNLNAHKEIHQRSSNPKHVCTICDVAYFHRSALHRHQRNDHAGQFVARSPSLDHGLLPGSHHSNSTTASHKSFQYTLPSLSLPGRMSLPPSNVLGFHPYTRPGMQSVAEHHHQQISCTYCNVKCDSLTDFNKHIAAIHFLSASRSCLINNCKHIVNTRAEFEEHSKMHPHAF